jgi:ABC-type dipeptide/oligopeptide/nickel transport system permease component
MGTYIARRLLQTVPVLLFTAVALFAVLHLIPGDPVLAMFGGKAFVSQEMVEAKRAELGLDRPLYVQFVAWLAELRP